MIYGYARVSTDGQSIDAQVKQLRDAGAGKVFRETASGARSDRAGADPVKNMRRFQHTLTLPGIASGTSFARKCCDPTLIISRRVNTLAADCDYGAFN
jgi:Resolvase, N terminal domain